MGGVAAAGGVGGDRVGWGPAGGVPGRVLLKYGLTRLAPTFRRAGSAVMTQYRRSGRDDSGAGTGRLRGSHIGDLLGDDLGDLRHKIPSVFGVSTISNC